MPTRLSTRLLLSYALLAATLLSAFAMAVQGVVRMNSLITALNDEELGNMEHEEAVHRASWAIEVVTRRGIVECDRNPGTGESIVEQVGTARSALEQRLHEAGSAINPRLRTAADGYLQFARRIEDDPTCDTVLGISLRQDRLALDEELTNAWIERLRELRLSIVNKEQEARRIGTKTTLYGATIGGIAVVVAAVLALLMSRSVSRSINELSQQARRIGEGDFTPDAPMQGPLEVRALSLELDRMRAHLAEIDQLKQAFIASISHDLRTPLTRVREALGLLADGTAGALTDRQARVVTLARSACEREIRLVWSLLDLSRIRAGHPLRLDTGSSIDRVVELVLTDLKEEADERGVTLHFERDGELPSASLDSALVERALSNLVSNAISVSSRGQQVHIERRVTSSGPAQAPAISSSWLQVIVRDDGPGVPEAVRNRLFTPFVSYDVGPRREYRGMGLGLSLAREMVRAHGGDVALIDSKTPGATFSLWIPLTHTALPAPVSALSTAAPEAT